jgi:hypothetical protein
LFLPWIIAFIPEHEGNCNARIDSGWQPIQHVGINFLDCSQADLKFHGIVDLGRLQTSANLAHGEHLRKDQPGSNRNQPISPPKNRVPQRPLREVPFPSTWVG